MMNNISHTKILPYRSDWPEKFEVEKEKLQRIFSDTALEVEHIGSTSIEGLSSKPIIDIVVMVKNHADADKFVKPLGGLGYWHDERNPSSERHFFRKGDPSKFHLSIAYSDKGGFWPRQILFRDYLRSHPDERDEYDKIKKESLKKDPTGGDGYIESKTEFVHKILDLADWKEGQKYGE